MIDQVPGDDRDIGQRVEPVDLGDRAPQEFGRIEPAVEQLARCEDVRIGQLDDDHWLLQVLIFVKSMIYIQGQLLTPFRDAKGITLTVKTLPSLVISAERLASGWPRLNMPKLRYADRLTAKCWPAACASRRHRCSGLLSNRALPPAA